MQHFEQLEHGQYYHIYNHGVGGRNLFADTNNYEYFWGLYDTYISPIAETYAWCLMPNHFHWLVRIKDVDDCLNLTGFEKQSGLKPLHQYFSNLFNAYTKAYNKWHGERGTLFERPFRRKLVNSDDYRKRVVVYIHNNPVHHGFCKHPLEYPWSSYLACTTEKLTKVKREEVVGWFGGLAGFVAAHDPAIERDEMDEWLGV